jgi:4'-phosphopantetheinyl transferase
MNIGGKEMYCIPSLHLHWDFPPDDRRLEGADVHVWAASLDTPLEKISSYERTLSSDERNRAKQFKLDHHRKRFVAGRGILRALLSSYAEIEPAKVQLRYSPQGKPFLAGFPEDCILQFNLAHSSDLMLIAITRVCSVGVDVERVQPATEIENVAKHFFSSGEARRLSALPKEQRISAFYKIFVRKEAYLKATGAGLSDMMSQIEVSFLPYQPTRILSISGDTQAAAYWTLMELGPAAGFIGAVAAEAKNLRFLLWQWPH